MTRSLPRLLLGLFVCTGCVGSCVSTDTGNAVIQAVSSRSADPSLLTGTDESGTVFTVHTARTSVRNLVFGFPEGTSCSDFDLSAFSAPVSCRDGVGFHVSGPYLVDLIGRSSLPALADLTIPAGTYRRVDMQWDLADEADGLVQPGDPLAGNTLHTTGTFVYRGNTVNFEMILGFSGVVLFESFEGISSRDFLLALDVALWLRELPITDCLDDGSLTITNGKLTITNGSGACLDIESALEDAIEASGELLADRG